MEFSALTPPFLDSNDNAGFLYIRPTFQCLNKLVLPENSTFLVAILLQKWEVPWAKALPLRLLLRLGAEFRCKFSQIFGTRFYLKSCAQSSYECGVRVVDYPCTLVSVSNRRPVYGEIGHTIMNLLIDFQHFRYQLPHVRGLAIYMRDKITHVRIPKNQYDDVRSIIHSHCFLMQLV